MVTYDIAISYQNSQRWLAGDLYNLAQQAGYKVFAHKFTHAHSTGLLNTKLARVYEHSRLNVMLWSKSYANEKNSGPVGIERQRLINRHIGEPESLLIVSVDNHPIHEDLSKHIYNNLTEVGVFGLLQMLFAQLGGITSVVESDGWRLDHPFETDAQRGDMKECKFRINPRYQGQGRWGSLADVLVHFDESPPMGTQYVFLIPSGNVPPELRHSIRLKNEPNLLESKRKATRDFIDSVGNKHLNGVWFPMHRGKHSFATVYCSSYDKHLCRAYNQLLKKSFESI